MLGGSHLLDLTQPISARMPYWPAPGYEPFRLRTINTLDQHGVYAGCFTMAEHMGTHVDAPNHFTAGGASVDELPLADFVCPLVVIDVRRAARECSDYDLQVSDVESWERANGHVPNGAAVFMDSGWDAYWSDAERALNRGTDGRLHFPGVSADAAAMLVHDRGARCIGVDTLSADNGVAVNSPVHHLVHDAGRLIVENLARLASAPPAGATVVFAPIPIEGGTGAPARIFAVW